MAVAGAQIVNADSAGAALYGQLPRTLSNRRKRGNVDVSATTTWNYTTSNCTITNAGNGDISLTAVSARTAYIDVSSTRDGITLPTQRIPVTRNDAEPAVVGGAGAPSFSVTVSQSITDTSFDGTPQVLAFGTMRSTAAGVLNVAAAIEYTAPSPQNGTLSVKWQWSLAGANVWTDWNGGTITGTTANGASDTPGFVNASGAITGRAVSTDHDLRAIGYKAGTTSALSAYGDASGYQ
jgi:hypothetical protein